MTGLQRSNDEKASVVFNRKAHVFIISYLYIMFGNFLLFFWKRPIAMTVEPLWLLEKNCEK